MTNTHKVQIQQMDPKTVEIYVDLDGVLADFELFLFDHYQIRVHSTLDEDMWAAVNHYDETGEWFYDLPKMERADHLMAYVRKYNPYILTATGRNYDRASLQKKRWAHEVFGIPMDRIITVPKSEKKGEYAAPNRILIDDNLQRSIKTWEAAGGVGIHHTNVRMTIAELKARGL